MTKRGRSNVILDALPSNIIPTTPPLNVIPTPAEGGEESRADAKDPKTLLPKQCGNPLADDFVFSWIQPKGVQGDPVLAFPDPGPDRRIAGF